MPAALGKRAKSGHRGQPHERISFEGKSNFPDKGNCNSHTGVVSFARGAFMKAELENAMIAARSLPPDELPRLLGELETARAVAWSRLAPPAAPVALQVPAARKIRDELLDVDEAATRLGMSAGYLYHNHQKFSFSRRV